MKKKEKKKEEGRHPNPNDSFDVQGISTTKSLIFGTTKE